VKVAVVLFAISRLLPEVDRSATVFSRFPAALRLSASCG